MVQSYSRVGRLLPWSVERALRNLKTDYADVLLLGLWNHAAPPRIVDQCLNLQQRGLVRHLALSTHHRPLISELASTSPYSIFHVRYNAIHRGAETEVFPLLPAVDPPGIVAFTATSWKQLLNSDRTPPGERTPTAADCYRFVLSNASVNVCMAAPSDMHQAQAIAAALELGPMNPDELQWMRRIGSHLYARKSAAGGAR